MSPASNVGCATITERFLSAILAHTYQCVSSSASDVTYSFPLPANASVHEFKAVIDQEHIIVGVVKEKAEAKAEYQKAVSRGKNAALLQQENVESRFLHDLSESLHKRTLTVFKMMLGNVKPFQTIEVQYVPQHGLQAVTAVFMELQHCLRRHRCP